MGTRMFLPWKPMSSHECMHVLPLNPCLPMLFCKKNQCLQNPSYRKTHSQPRKPMSLPYCDVKKTISSRIQLEKSCGFAIFMLLILQCILSIIEGNPCCHSKTFKYITHIINTSNSACKANPWLSNLAYKQYNHVNHSRKCFQSTSRTKKACSISPHLLSNIKKKPI